ncbi:hypothetical protein J6590_106622 [Homalodisca vitripennis]|nr:hypothetical protein J6590_106622 [Homalodisca vitripennis]
MKEKCASHRPPEQEEKGSGALARVPRGRYYPYGLESKTAPEGKRKVTLECGYRLAAGKSPAVTTLTVINDLNNKLQSGNLSCEHFSMSVVSLSLPQVH